MTKWLDENRDPSEAEAKKWLAEHDDDSGDETTREICQTVVAIADHPVRLTGAVPPVDRSRRPDGTAY
jgi:hypothetical protein